MRLCRLLGPSPASPSFSDAARLAVPDKKLRKARVEINTSDRPSHRDCLFAVGEGGSPQTRTSRGLRAPVNFSQFTFPFARYRTKKLASAKPPAAFLFPIFAEREVFRSSPGRRSYFVVVRPDCRDFASCLEILRLQDCSL